MNAEQRLRNWVSEWRSQRLLTEDLSEVAESPVTTPTPGLPRHTVSSHGGVEGLLLAQLTASITPDDAQRAELAGAAAVSAGGLSVSRVPLLRGQVRQLNPVLKPDWTRPVIVLVLAVEEAQERVLVAPFSEFSEPALDAELSTGLDDDSLAVLCLWNASWIALNTLRHSWWLTDVPETLTAEADRLRACRSRREPLPPSLQDRIGPPITHPLDPRHDYLDLEAGLLEGLAQDV